MKSPDILATATPASAAAASQTATRQPATEPDQAGTPLGMLEKESLQSYLRKWSGTIETLRELATNLHNSGHVLLKAQTKEEADMILQEVHLNFTEAQTIVTQVFFGVVAVRTAPDAKGRSKGKEPESQILVRDTKIIVSR